MNYLEKVKEFRAATGLDAGQSVELHDKLIREELAELADALADSVVVVSGKRSDGLIGDDEYRHRIGHLMESAYWAGIDLDAAFNIVHESNMSKLCTTDELKPTMAKYEKLDVELEIKPVQDGLFAVFSATDHPDYPKGKLLKSVGYRAPDWSGDEWIV